jgi:uncharacterized protein YodC (DUF2158 family)
MEKREHATRASNLLLVAPAADFQSESEACLGIGDIVVLNSGSPKMMIVDINPHGTVIAAWRGGEASFSSACLHRVSPF